MMKNVSVGIKNTQDSPVARIYIMSKSKIIRLFPIIMICLIISSSCSSELQVRESSDMPETGSGPGVEETVSTETNSVPEAPTENGSVPANSDDEELPRPSSTEEVDPPPPPPPPPPPNPPCQILSTPVLRIAGIPFTNNARCEEQRMKCEMCGKFFCPYHHEINRDNSPNGGHICQPSQP